MGSSLIEISLRVYNSGMEKEPSVFFSSLFEQRKTVDTLLEESRTDEDFYIFLSFASFITTLGLLLDNAVIVIAAMLIAPLLFPILALGMGIVTSSRFAIQRSFTVLLKSIAVILGISAITAFLVSGSYDTYGGNQIVIASTPDIIFFLAAFLAGCIAAYTWVRQNVSASLPSVAMTVSLVTPLATVGIAVSILSREMFTGALMLFLLNLLAIVVSSTIIFSLFGFSRLQKWQDKKIEEEKKEEENIPQESV